MNQGSEAEYFDREYFELHPGKEKYLRDLIKLLRRWGTHSGKVLDVGSGFGFLLEALKLAGFDPAGIEQSQVAADKSLSRIACPVYVQSAEEPFPIPDGTYDAITMCDVVEHLSDYQRSFRECRRVLKSGGQMYVITLNKWSIARFLLGKEWSWYKDPTHVHMFSAREISGALKSAGFAETWSRTFFNFCVVGESTPLLKPLRQLGQLVYVPACGDSFVTIAKK